MFNKLKSKLKKSTEIALPISYIGVIDEVTCNRVRGWVALSDNTAITQPVTIKINDYVIEITALSYREDLEQHGIANGNAAFDISFNSDETSELIVEVFVDDERVLFNKLIIGEDFIKNKDPYFIDFYKKSILKNKTSRLDDGLNIQLIQASEYEKTFCSNFFYRISNSKFSQEHNIKIGQRLLNDIFSNDIIELTINTNKSFQAIIELLDENQNTLIGNRIDVTPGWKTYETSLHNFNYEMLEKAKSIIISINVGSSSYIDLGNIIIRENNNKYIPNKPKFEKIEIKKDSISIINDTFAGSRLSETYTKLKRKQLLASGIVYETKDDPKNEIMAKLSSKGIDLKINEIKGYSRISYSLDISNLSSMPIQGVISGTGDCQNIIKNIYIYAKGKTDKILNKPKLWFSYENNLNQWFFSISYTEACKLLSTTSDNYEYRLAIEFNSKTEIENFYLSLKQEQKIVKEEIFCAIEDTAISSQLDIISGYYDILKNDEPSNSNKDITLRKPNDSVIDIVIPIYNAKEFVIECLESIIKYTTTKYRIIAVDDCSTDGISEVLDEYEKKYDFIFVYHHEHNVGYTANVNKGFELSESEWVLLLNSDTVVTPYWLENLLEATQEDNVAIIGPLGNAASWQSVPNVLSKQGGWDFNLLPDNITPSDIAFQLNINRQSTFAEAGVLNGFCQLINRNIFFEVGGLDEIAFPKGYGEENDLCARLIEKGYRLLVCPNSYVYHHKSKSFGHDIRTELSEKGSAALKKKHPNYNWSLVSKQLYNHDVLIKARRTITPLYSN